ncbi:MAG: hypothetical protein ACJAUV_002173 [Flavobacteriales bacterium]|jgi:hypothetical protein
MNLIKIKIGFQFVLFLLMTFSVSAERYWYSPSSEGVIYRPGQTVNIQRGSNSMDRWHKLIVTFNGFNNSSFPATQLVNYEAYTATAEGNCSSFADTQFYYTIPCNWYGTFEIEIKHERRRDVCIFGNWVSDGSSRRMFEVLPEIANAPVEPLHNACPGEEYTITLDNPNNMDGARWYSSLVEPIYFNDGFSYTNEYTAALTTHYVSYYLQDAACINESAKTPIVVSAIDINGLIPPVVQFKSYCKEGTYRIEVANPNNYSGALWYNEYNAPNPIQDDFYLEQYFRQGARVLYVQYYDDSHGCRQYSERTPINVVVIPQPNLNIRPNASNRFEIKDHRDVPNADCFDLQDYYHDLNDGINDEEVREQAQTFFDALFETINNKNPVTEIQTSVLRNYRWIPSDYNIVGAENRVCGDNITSQQGMYATKKYTYVATLDYTVTIRDTEGNILTEEPRSCTVELRNKWVNNTPIGGRSPVERCTPPDVATVQALLDPNQASNCTAAEVRRICPGSTITLGPPSAPIGALSYSWSPSTGLSDPTVANPTIHYDAVPVATYQIMKYILTVSYPPLLGSDQDFCYYIYKCDKCGPFEDVEDKLRN